MTKGKGFLSIAAVMVLGLIDSPAVVAQGWKAEGVRKTNGDFPTTSTTFVTVTGTTIPFTSAAGTAVLSASATVRGGNCPASQIGIKVDGTNYEGEWSQAVTQAGGVAVRGMPVGAVIAVNLPAGAHTAEVILRHRTIDPICNSANLAADTDTPLSFVVEYPVPIGAVPALSIVGTVLLFAGLLTAALLQLRRRRITHST